MPELKDKAQQFGCAYPGFEAYVRELGGFGISGVERSELCAESSSLCMDEDSEDSSEHGKHSETTNMPMVTTAIHNHVWRHGHALAPVLVVSCKASHGGNDDR